MATSVKEARKVVTKEKAEDTGKSGGGLGVLYTGYLDKRNPITGSYKKRFVVLTQNALHWFKRDDTDDLFGEERGQLTMTNILTNRILDEDQTIFEIQGVDGKKRVFRATSNVFCEEWVSAIRSAVKAMARSRPNPARRGSMGALRHADHDEDDEDAGLEKPEVTVLLVSLLSEVQGNEIVMARNPNWGRVVMLPSIRKGDSVILSISNGGSVTLSYDIIVSKLEENGEFDVGVQNVPLASSVRLSLCLTGLQQAVQGLSSSHTSSSERSRRLGRQLSLTMREKLFEVAQVIASDRSSAVNVVLSLMTLMAACSSCGDIGQEALLLYLFAAGLALYNLYQMYDETRADHPNNHQSQLSVCLIVHSHAFTSADNPIVATDNDIPQRFIDGCDGDLKEARRRWDITRHWRESEGVNNILTEPQPYFDLVHAMYPHYYCSRGKSGHVVYFERPGDFDGAQLYARGVTLEDLVRHWLFVTEYQWQVLCKGDETAKSITVLDIAKVKMTDLAGNNLEYLKRTIAIANQHYPERSYSILIVNVPYFFTFLYNMVKPLVHENTQKKVRILSPKDTLKGLLEYIDIENIPEYYGGKLDFGGHDSCRFQCQEMRDVHEFVRKLNEEHAAGASKTSPFDQNEVTGSALPPGLPGELPSANVSSRESSSTSDSIAAAQPAVGTTATTRAMARRASLSGAPQRSSALSGTSATNDHREDDYSISSATTTATSASSARTR